MLDGGKMERERERMCESGRKKMERIIGRAGGEQATPTHHSPLTTAVPESL